MGDPAGMRYATPRLRQIATRLLAHEMGGEPATAASLAAASGRLLDRLSFRLAEVAGFQMHLRKPVDPSDLVAAVASLAAGAKPCQE